MKTLLEVILLSEAYLKEKQVPRSRREAEELIADVFGLRRLDLYLQFERPLEDVELEKCREALKRRGKREPLQYIAGVMSFAGLTLKVNSSVLIPRMETEILIEKISSDLKEFSLEGGVLLDLCAGSGCIGLALKKRFPSLDVYLSDISEQALQVAKENALQNDCEVTFLQGDLFSSFKDLKCDFFVCNPPYVSEKEFQDLSPEVKSYEPKVALVSGQTGLEFYQKIASELPHYLNKKGKGWLEIGSGQGKRVKEYFESLGWKNCKVEQDWAGHDRFFSLERDSFFS